MSKDSHKAYDLIAIAAGHQAGLAGLPPVVEAAYLPDPKRQEYCAAVADNPAAVKLRDELFLEFDRRLRDPGYGGDQTWKWFQNTYAPIGRSSIFRARADLRAGESRIAEIAADAKAYMELAASEGADSVFGAATQRAGQLIFQLLMDLRSEDLAGKKPDPLKIIRTFEALAKLQKARAETELLGVKLREARDAFDMATNAAKASSGDGRLSAEQIGEIRRAVFGDAA